MSDLPYRVAESCGDENKIVFSPPFWLPRFVARKHGKAIVAVVVAIAVALVSLVLVPKAGMYVLAAEVGLGIASVGRSWPSSLEWVPAKGELILVKQTLFAPLSRRVRGADVVGLAVVTVLPGRQGMFELRLLLREEGTVVIDRGRDARVLEQARALAFEFLVRHGVIAAAIPSLDTA